MRQNYRLGVMRKPPRQPDMADLMLQAKRWNEAHPVGTEVLYHPVIGGTEARRRRTRSEAFVLSGHTVCVFLEDETGCVALDACTEAPK